MAVLGTEDVLREEAKAIHGVDLSKATGAALYQSLNERNSAALCLSGGGIRSAAFALGVIQALAVHPRPANESADADKTEARQERPEQSLLSKFHYLSTVSGGGYIGSWLSVWRSRTDFATVWRNLVARPEGADVEPQPLTWLRSHSSYLSPKLSVTSAEIWAASAMYVGNLILNWLVILPVVCGVILLLKIMSFSLNWWSLKEELQWQLPLFFVGATCLIVTLASTTRNRPSRSRRGPASGGSRIGQVRFLTTNLSWAFISAITLTQSLGSDGITGLGRIHVNEHTVSLLYPKGAYVAAGALMGAALYTLGWVAGRPQKRDAVDLLTWGLSGLVYGALIGLGFLLYIHIPVESKGFTNVTSFYLMVGVSWVLGSQFLAQVVFVGVTSRRKQSEEDQEWLIRAGGWLLIAGCGWFLMMMLTHTPFLAWMGRSVSTIGILAWWAIGGLVGFAAALIGSSRFSLARSGEAGRTSTMADTALLLAVPLFAAALIIALSLALDRLLLKEFMFQSKLQPASETLNLNYTPFPRNEVMRLLFGLAACMAIGLIAWRCVNINRCSLHAFYRNRLVRTFLGASREHRERQANPFTGFDAADDFKMHKLWPPEKDTGWQPFQVINTTLNIVSAKKRGWQERKAAPFTVSPLHCGTGIKLTALNPKRDSKKKLGAYRRSKSYGGRSTQPGQPSGISVGTAMAISGAAASPNMGYHSSPAVTFLMTMFNVRLGWWLGNPGVEGEHTHTEEGPATAIVPLVYELFGLTTDDWKYVYLSDGGHFENLGLYEMVRRRCRFILISDAGCDRDFKFEDLGNAVRKISIDLNVPIRFVKLERLRKRPGDGIMLDGDECSYHAIGEIDYPTADRGGQKGVIVYVKAGYRGIEGAGIRSYAMAHLDFPHQSTLNQWFNESQFESYRALGFEIMDGILSEALRHKVCASVQSLENIGKALDDLARKSRSSQEARSEAEVPMGDRDRIRALRPSPGGPEEPSRASR